MSASAYPACLPCYPIPKADSAEKNDKKASATQINDDRSKGVRASNTENKQKKNQNQNQNQKLGNLRASAPAFVPNYGGTKKNIDTPNTNTTYKKPVRNYNYTRRQVIHVRDLAEFKTINNPSVSYSHFDSDGISYDARISKFKNEMAVDIQRQTTPTTSTQEKVNQHLQTPFIPFIQNKFLDMIKQMKMVSSESEAFLDIVTQQMVDFGKCSILSTTSKSRYEYCKSLVDVLCLMLGSDEFTHAQQLVNFYQECLDHLIVLFYFGGKPPQPSPVQWQLSGRVAKELQHMSSSEEIKVSDAEITDDGVFMRGKCHFLVRDLINVDLLFGKKIAEASITKDATFTIEFKVAVSMVPWVSPSLELHGMPPILADEIPFMHGSSFCIQFLQQTWSPATSIINNVLSIASSIQDLIMDNRQNPPCDCKDLVIFSHLAPKRA